MIDSYEDNHQPRNVISAAQMTARLMLLQTLILRATYGMTFPVRRTITGHLEKSAPVSRPT